MRKVIQRTIRGDVKEQFLVRATAGRNLNVKFIITHDHPKTSSHIAIGILASQRAKVTVDAVTIIRPSAPDSQAWLEIRAVASDDAVIAAAPNLEIYNNAVKAGHALTTKHISDIELFYLTSRGLNPRQAQKLIIDAALKPFRKAQVIS
ncbi:MAG: SufD family Fe-S cluster assembly protein [Candidatus Nomurabacteria bacterium]|jgi:Fe-S cluster assembly protein SufD|nr:SufD family Fe-S cluster assembly protein [Candidatus Nomurabacteria bacterium]